jgi:hypothetical protein
MAKLPLKTEINLKAQLESALAFFRAPPADICTRYGLIIGQPIDILIGPDVESFLRKDGTNIIPTQSSTDDVHRTCRLDLIKNVRTAMLDENLIADQDGITIDDNTLEHKLKPVPPLESCENFIRAKILLRKLSAQQGISAHVGNGHTHMSFFQNKSSLLSQCKDFDFSHFFKGALQGIYDFQAAFPAFFIKPITAESTHHPLFSEADSSQTYTGPHHLSFHSVCNTASIRAKFHLNLSGKTYYTLEPRLTKYAPFYPLALYLTAVKNGLNRNTTPWSQQRKNYSNWTPEEFERHNKKQLMQYSPRTRKGLRGYLDMLHRTFENLQRHNPFLPGLAEDLLRLSIEEYRTYLDRPTAQSRYTARQLQSLRADIDAFETCVTAEFRAAPKNAPAHAQPELVMVS